MKRIPSSDSLGVLTSMCPPTVTFTDEHSPRNREHLYSREFQSMLDGFDDEGCIDEVDHGSSKKRRLSVDQVKALEKNFETKNKLEPERKVKLAQELGLHPRQVAVWFQNRRVRWKTKQLERDSGVLKANLDALKVNFDALKHDNELLLKEIQELKSKMKEENSNESNLSVKEEEVFNEGNSNSSTTPAISSSKAVQSPEPEKFITSTPGGLQLQKVFQPPTSQNQYSKADERDFFGSDEASIFFSVEQPPSLHWYCPDQWY